MYEQKLNLESYTILRMKLSITIQLNNYNQITVFSTLSRCLSLCTLVESHARFNCTRDCYDLSRLYTKQSSPYLGPGDHDTPIPILTAGVRLGDRSCGTMFLVGTWARINSSELRWQRWTKTNIQYYHHQVPNDLPLPCFLIRY